MVKLNILKIMETNNLKTDKELLKLVGEFIKYNTRKRGTKNAATNNRVIPEAATLQKHLREKYNILVNWEDEQDQGLKIVFTLMRYLIKRFPERFKN